MKRRLLSLLLAAVMLFSLVPGVAAAQSGAQTTAQQAADALHSLGLFQGTGTNADGSPIYALERSPSRLEALTMLVRVLGQEKQALASASAHPFTDVQPWADAYVGYAYQSGLTKGTSPTSFGSGNVDAAQYLTFVLRALGYSDGMWGDFTWNDPFPLATQVDIIPEGVDVNNFRRSDVALISYAALSTKVKGSDQTLAQKLLGVQAFTQAQYDALFSVSQGDVLTPTQISDKCAPAVFYIETYFLNGTSRGSGSGFLISPDGLAITNYHVVADSCDAFAMTSDGTFYDLLLLDGDPEADLALVKLDSDGVVFPYLELNTTDPVRQGQQVYAIGSPRGLENTMSQGIVSNPSRVLDGTEYIQISVPIAPGSSGGALLNEKGQVIGITSAGLMNSTGDLNLAISARQTSILDFSATKDTFLFSLTPYSCVDYVPDFGIFSGARLLNQKNALLIGGIYEYDMWDFHTNFGSDENERYAISIALYEKYLADLGFVKKKTWFDGMTTPYIGQTETVYLVLDYDNMKITVKPSRNFQYYPDTGLIDFGWCAGVEATPGRGSNGSYIWGYSWRDYFTPQEMAMYLDEYLDLIEYSGYKLISADDGKYYYEYLGKSVVFMLEERDFFVVFFPKGTL